MPRLPLHQQILHDHIYICRLNLLFWALLMHKSFSKFIAGLNYDPPINLVCGNEYFSEVTMSITNQFLDCCMFSVTHRNIVTMPIPMVSKPMTVK